MIRVTGYWRDAKVVRYFYDRYDAIDFKDIVDANYPIKVTFEKGVFSMREWIYDCWNGVMNADVNPLSKIPHTNTRHMVLQVLAWMWCIVFSSWVGSILVFGISAFVHAILLAGVFITLAVFETAKRKPAYFGSLGRANGGEHE